MGGESVQHIGHQQFLMLLFVMQPKFDDRRDLRRQIAAIAAAQRRIDMMAVSA